MSLLVVVERELGEADEGDGVGLADGMHAQAVHHAGGVVEADDIGEPDKCFLGVPGIVGGQVVCEPHPFAAQAGCVVAEIVNLGLRAGLVGHHHCRIHTAIVRPATPDIALDNLRL
jgi:hypothetical protein